MRTSPLPGLLRKNKQSPLRKPMHKMPDGTMMPGATHKQSPMRVDTTLADRVYSSGKVDKELRDRNLHTFKGGRGTKNTSTGTTNDSVNNAMIDPSV